MRDESRKYLGVMVDMAGCPNRCRHCWLGGKKNGHFSREEFREIAEFFRSWRDEQGRGFDEFGFFSWWREPDYREDYRLLWEMEKTLSSPGRAERFELLSTWRLARDDSYAAWAAAQGTAACQITFFGMEATTDWGMRRRGAFRDQLRATERCRDVGITPRWQLFLTKRSLPELPAFWQLIREYAIKDFFIGGISPEGSGYELETERLEASDLPAIPPALIAHSRDGLALLGRPEGELLEEMHNDSRPPRLSVPSPCLAVDADGDVYPNLAEPSAWWRLGNLYTDGADAVIRAFLGETPPGMQANRRIPLSRLARRYGDANSTRLYVRGDLVRRFLHQWGIESGTENGLAEG